MQKKHRLQKESACLRVGSKQQEAVFAATSSEEPCTKGLKAL